MFFFFFRALATTSLVLLDCCFFSSLRPRISPGVKLLMEILHQLVDSLSCLSHYSHLFTGFWTDIPGGAGFLPSFVETCYYVCLKTIWRGILNCKLLIHSFSRGLLLRFAFPWICVKTCLLNLSPIFGDVCFTKKFQPSEKYKAKWVDVVSTMSIHQ